MNSSDSNRFSRAPIDDQVKQFSLSQFRSMGLVHIVGYGILLLTFVDLFSILFPPRFMNPTWEFQAFGQCIERVPVLFLGLVLIFFGEENPRGNFERTFVKLLSWFTLVLAVVCFLLVPIGIFNTIRIDQTNEQRANFELDQQLSQLRRIRTQIERADSSADLRGLTSLLGTSSSAPNVTSSDLGETQDRLYKVIRNREQLFLANNGRRISRQSRALLKQCFKWTIGSVIAGILLLLTWVNTRWARL
ncbi:MAG: HpsJ family protein [Cyanobacteria bacterium P01_F01_bin.3]